MKSQTFLWVCLAAGSMIGCGDSRTPEAVASAASTPAASASVDEIQLPADSPKLRRLRVEEVRTAEVPTDEVVAPGKIETNPNRVSRIALPLPGRIAAVLVHLGDAVRAGQPVLTLESPEADAAVSACLQAESAVTNAKAAVSRFQADHDRVRDLFEHGAAPKKDVLHAENDVVQAKAALEQAEAATAQAVQRIGMLGLKPGQFGQKVTMNAPISGKVLEIGVAAGEFRNDTNAPLLTIADLSTVWVASDVPESMIRFIQRGERLEIELTAFPGETFQGRVTQIADTVDPETRTIKVRAQIDNARGRLRPEMFGRIRHIESVQRMPVVPSGAVLQGNGRALVYVEPKPGQFIQREVATGKPLGDLIPIVKGLQPGERVVVDGAILLKGTS